MPGTVSSNKKNIAHIKSRKGKLTAVQQAVDEEEDRLQEKVKEGCSDNPGAFGRPPLCGCRNIR